MLTIKKLKTILSKINKDKYNFPLIHGKFAYTDFCEGCFPVTELEIEDSKLIFKLGREEIIGCDQKVYFENCIMIKDIILFLKNNKNKIKDNFKCVANGFVLCDEECGCKEINIDYIKLLTKDTDFCSELEDDNTSKQLLKKCFTLE